MTTTSASRSCAGNGAATGGTSPSSARRSRRRAREVRWLRDVWARLEPPPSPLRRCMAMVGGGFEMAMPCDQCIAASDARFALPETGLGHSRGRWHADAATARPRSRRGLILTGAWLDARAAHRLGLVAQVARPRLHATALSPLDASPDTTRSWSAASSAPSRWLDQALRDGLALERRLALSDVAPNHPASDGARLEHSQLVSIPAQIFRDQRSGRGSALHVRVSLVGGAPARQRAAPAYAARRPGGRPADELGPVHRRILRSRRCRRRVRPAQLPRQAARARVHDRDRGDQSAAGRRALCAGHRRHAPAVAVAAYAGGARRCPAVHAVARGSHRGRERGLRRAGRRHDEQTILRTQRTTSSRRR